MTNMIPHSNNNIQAVTLKYDSKKHKENAEDFHEIPSVAVEQEYLIITGWDDIGEPLIAGEVPQRGLRAKNLRKLNEYQWGDETTITVTLLYDVTKREVLYRGSWCKVGAAARVMCNVFQQTVKELAQESI